MGVASRRRTTVPGIATVPGRDKWIRKRTQRYLTINVGRMEDVLGGTFIEMKVSLALLTLIVFCTARNGRVGLAYFGQLRKDSVISQTNEQH